MGYKLSKIITKHGDKGSTRLGDKSIVPKSSERIMALGSIDETNSAIGLLKVYIKEAPLRDNLTLIQHHILILGSEFAGTGRSFLKPRHIEFLEHWAHELMQQLSPEYDFVLPQGGISASHCHMARTACRRAERFVVAASLQDPKHTELAIQYLNRLSDVLFVLARVLNKLEGIPEIVLDREL